jgi:hypothetical protein
LTIWKKIGITKKREIKMSEKIKKNYRVYTVKTIITEYSVDDQNALWSCLNDGVILSEDQMSEEPFLSELRNGGDR